MGRSFVRTSALLCLIFLAASLQFWLLSAQSLWYDEGFSFWLAEKSLSEIVALTAADIQPPLYYLLLHGWIKLTGKGEFALRFLSAFFAVLTVPLMWQVGRRLLKQQAAAYVAAFLVAISPLWLWYGREVRNYSLSLALILGAMWLLVGLLEEGRAKRNDGGQRVIVLAFGLLMAAGLYTHYFILFVLAGWGSAALIWWLSAPSRQRIFLLIATFGLPLLLYLPWVSIIMQRLGADRSYWEGTLSLINVLEKALASWMVGHSMFEVTAIPLGYFGLGLACGGLIMAGWRAVGRPFSLTLKSRVPPLPLHHWFLTFFWLIFPVICFLIVAWNRPKFNPRYLIFAAPAFMLAISALIGVLWQYKWMGRLIASLLLLILIGIFSVADWNLFYDGNFGKADWREVARYIKQHQQPHEPILLVSGHVFPIFHYYYPSQEGVIRLPNEYTLDTTAVLGLDVSQTLAQALRPLTANLSPSQPLSLWVVNWQDKVVDPEGVVPAIFTAAGGKEIPTPRFMEVRLSYWQLPPSANLTEALRPHVMLDVQFEHALRLIGWSALPNAPPVDEGLGLVLYWMAQRPLDKDYKVHLRVIDQTGFEYGVYDERPTSYHFPTFRWPPREPRIATLQVPLQPGTPPGDYWVEVSLYEEQASPVNLNILDSAGAPQGQSLRIGPFAVAPPSMNWLAAGPPNHVKLFEKELLDHQQLLAIDATWPTEWEAGQEMPITLWWRTSGPLPGATLHLGWQQEGHLVEDQAWPLMAPNWTGEKWRSGDLLMTPLLINIPRHIQAGATQLTLWLSDAQSRQSTPIILANGQVITTNRSFNPPTVPLAQVATFGETIQLLGYELKSSTKADNSPNSQKLTLYWQTLGEMEEKLTTFVHLLDANGTIIPNAGQDKLPLDGTRPTSSWLTGEYLTDTFTIQLPTPSPPMPYTIEIGWYNANDPTFPRLPAQGIGADGDRVLLQTKLP